MKYDIKYLNISLKLSYKKLLKELTKNTSWILIWFCRYYNFRCLMTMGFMFFGWSVRELAREPNNGPLSVRLSSILSSDILTAERRRNKLGLPHNIKFQFAKMFFRKIFKFYIIFFVFIPTKNCNSLEMFEYQRYFEKHLECIPFCFLSQ